MALWRSGALRVVELGGGIPAAFAARLLADWGADVIKVEDPAGDPSRGAGPFPGDVPHAEKSGLYLYLNFGKRGITLDLDSDAGKVRLAALFADADVVIEDLGAGMFDRLVARGAIPVRLVVCSISPYGQEGPKAHYLGSELSAYASGGLMAMTGTAARPPLKHGGNQASHLAGVNAAAAALAAVRLAQRTGRGQRIDISEQETIALTIFPALTVYSHTGGVVKRAPDTLPKLQTSQAMEASDGWIMPADAGIDLWWESFAAFVDRLELLDPPFGERESRHQHEREIDDIVGPAFRARTKADLFHNGQEQGLTMSAVQTPAEIDVCPHLSERAFFVEQQHPVAGGIRIPGMVPLTGAVVDREPSRPAPLLGQHNDEVEAALRQLDRPLRGPAPAPTPATGDLLPLRGLRILELGMVFVLPLAITPLAALGADVIKVESESRPDSVRSGPMPDNTARPAAWDHAGNFHLLNRNKRGIALDLTTERGKELFLRLVALSDVVAENFTPRVLRNLGLSYERLRQANPRIILLSSTGFGQAGPWQNYKAYGPTTESVDGLMHLTGHPDGPPTRGGAGGFGVAFTDVAGAYYGSYALLAALDRRERTGEGAWLDLSHYEAGIATLPEPMLDYVMNGRVQGRAGNRRWDRAPQGAYACRGADDWVAISVASFEQFGTLAGVLRLPISDLAAFETVEARRRHHDRLDALIGGATRRWSAIELEAELQNRGVEATRLASVKDVWLDPQLRARGFGEVVPAPAYAPEIGPRVYPRPSWRMSLTPAATRIHAPAFGEHTHEVLGELLGLDDGELTRLEGDGVIARAPRPGLVSARRHDLGELLAASRLSEVDPDFRSRLESQFGPIPLPHDEGRPRR